MNTEWSDVQLFLAIAESGSLSRAAKQLLLSQPTVSRRLGQLESALGYPLFRRQPSGIALTSAGERLLVPARRMAEWAGELGRAAAVSHTELHGVVRVATAPGIAFDFVTPFAAWLRSKHPGLRLELLCSVDYLDLARGEADLALRLRPPTDSDLTVVATLHYRNGAFASPDYVARLPPRYGLADLAWICWAPPYEDLPPNPQLAKLLPGFVPAFTSDNYLVQWRAAEAGLGAIIRADIRHRFAQSTLLPLPLDLGPYAYSDLYLVCARSALDIRRVRTVSDLLATELSRLQSLP
jgi:DNA-binding transcriptional LysR family regulator